MFQLKIDHCSRDDADDLSDLLEEMGALSVTLTDLHDSPILEPEIGTTPLWADVVIQALYADEEEGRHVLSRLAMMHPQLSISLEHVLEKDWERVCMADFQPMRFGKRLWICPSWITPPQPDAVNLTLDPGLAFGTGTHPTTSLCLTWLDQADLSNKRLIDYGCGSGILALAALKLGASHVLAVDLDAQALIATRNNAEINHFTEQDLTVLFPNELHEPVELIIANILLLPLLQLRDEFCRLLKPGGLLVVSGILDSQVEQLITAYQSDFSHQETSTQEEWCLVVFTKLH